MISTKKIESNTLDLCSAKGYCEFFVHVDLESNTLNLGFGFREHAEEIRRRRKKDFFAGGFGFAGRDGNRGVDFVLQVTLWGGSLLLLPLLLFLLSSSSPSYCFVLLLCSCLFLRLVKLNRVRET